MTAPDFVPHAKLQKMVVLHAAKCVEFMFNKAGLSADYSDEFVPEIENLLHHLHLQRATANFSDETIEALSIQFGSYLGETYRRNHGGEWGISGEDPALRFGGGFHSLPFDRVLKRLTNGEEDNVYHWYTGMLNYASAGPTPKSRRAVPPPLPKGGPPPLPATKAPFLLGYGILVKFIILGCVGASILLTVSLAPDPHYISNNPWPGGVGLIVAGVACWYLGGWLPKRHNRISIDPQTGKGVVLRPSTSFLFIPMRAWGPILGAVGLLLVVGNIIDRFLASSNPAEARPATPAPKP